MSPKVSVLLPVYNVAPYISDTIHSILRQTFLDFEIIVVDDLSTDNTVEIIQSIADPRIRVICNSVNMGRAGSDMHGLQYVSGKYIAKMDGDDICQPERLAEQVEFLDEHPEINVVGSWMQNFGASKYLNTYPEQPDDTQVLTLFTLPTGNPSVMMRTALFTQEGMFYDVSLRQTEDYDFFVRYIREIKLYNFQKSFVHYRVPDNKSKENILSERSLVSDIVRSDFLKSWKFPDNNNSFYIYNLVSMLDRPLGKITFPEVEKWFNDVLEHNKKYPIFDQSALLRGLGKRWFEFCYTYLMFSSDSVKYYRRSVLYKHFDPTYFQKLKFVFRLFLVSVKKR